MASATGTSAPSSARGDNVRAPDSRAQIYVRPHDLEVHRERNGKPCWKARVERVTPLGGVVRLELSIDDRHAIHLELPSDQSVDLNPARGDSVFVVPRQINVFDPREHTFHPVSLYETTT